MYSHMLQQRAKHFSVDHQVDSTAAVSPSKQRKIKTK